MTSAATDGFCLTDLFHLTQGRGVTYDDLIILPRFVEEPPAKVNLRVELAPGISIYPVITSPMDRVTEWETAVHAALNGCLGFLHVNLDVEEAVRQLSKVKRYQMGYIWEPLCRAPHQAVAEARAVKREYGFSTILVTEDGTPHSRFLGLVTRTCFDFETDASRTLGQVMVPRDRLLVASRSSVPDLDAARAVLKANPHVTKLPVLEDDGSVYALINRRNLAASSDYPEAAVDRNSQLLVGAAVTTHPDDDQRVLRLIKAGADALLIDSSQGGTGYAVRRLRQIRDLAPNLPIIAGNTVTVGQTAPLIAAGANAIRVGMGPGSICITQDQYGLGRAQGSAVYELGLHAGSPVIADGGIRHIGDMVKALALGATAVMVGRYVAGCDETPSPVVEHHGRRYKLYRGMGSLGAMRARKSNRYTDGGNHEVVAQGVEDSLVPAIGPLDQRLRETLTGIKGALRQLGCASVAELHQLVRDGGLRFELRSEAAKREGAAHDIEPLPRGS